MAEKLFHCDTCGVHFTGPQPAMQHYDGSKHRKKEALKLAQSSTVFSADVVGPNGVSHSIAPSASGPERQTGSLDMAPLRSVDQMKSDNTLKSTESEPRCNFVMVPSLNPNLPPVRVTMIENALPQTEYEFHGSCGCCYLCGIQLTSQQHVDQHLSGQKHTKAKRRWEARREQLQLTVSGLCASMKSKPIALCEPLVSEMPTSSDAVSKQNYSNRSVPSAATIASESTSAVHGMHWYSCEVCNKKMNTIEMLELHKRSPVHLKKVERQQLGAACVDNTVWLLCPTCQKKLNSPTQLEIHMASHSRPISLSRSPADDPEDRTTPTYGVQCYRHDIYDTYVNRSVQSDLNLQSLVAGQSDNVPSVKIGDNTVWQFCPVCAKPLNSLKQLDIHIKSHGVSGRSLLSDVPRNKEDSNAQDQLRPTADIDGVSRNADTAEQSNPQIAVREKIDVTNLLKVVEQLRIKEATLQDDVESLTRPVSLYNSDNQTAGQTDCTPHVVINNADDVESLTRPVNLYNSDNQTAGQTDGTAHIVITNAAHDGIVTSENQLLRSARLDSKTECKSTSPATWLDGNATATADADAEKLITDDDLITSGCSVCVSCVYHCQLCNVHLTGDEPRNMHVTGTRHMLCRQKAEEATLPEQNPFSPNFRYFCRLCNVPFNTLRDKKQHERGQQHISKSVRYVPAPDRIMPDLVLDNDNCMPASLLSSKPRSYQEELYFKALAADSICFLPTGTGKTLVAVMLMSRLLTLNPRHSVIFVVDRILLALQQSRVIRRELGDKLFDRWSEQLQTTESRKLRLAMLCGAKGDVHDASLWQQDVIVITAALYVNLLESGSLRWADNCLVVIDEVHHCLKDHPYRRLIQLCRHWQLAVCRRPRLLGLTASPAGRDTTAATLLLLHELISNVAVEKLITVQRHVHELARYQSTATLDIRLISYSCSEQQLGLELRRYVLRCCLELDQLALHSWSLRQLDGVSSLSPQNLEDVASRLHLEVVQCLSYVVDTAEAIDPSCKVLVAFLAAHIKVLCQALETLDSLGLENAYNELAILLKPHYVASFSHAQQAGLPCAELQSLVSGYLEAENRTHSLLTVTNDDMSESMKKSATYMQLVHELVTWWDYGRSQSDAQWQTALVLVRKRSVATVLCELLECCQSLQSRQMSVVHIVGHGSSRSDCGMSVQQQARTLHDIQCGKYNVIVATSVAEEGLDLPDCDLVIQLDAADCVRALVQVRGRARKPHSRFIAFCRDAAQKSRLNTLLLQEQNMTDAVSQIINSNLA